MCRFFPPTWVLAGLSIWHGSFLFLPLSLPVLSYYTLLFSSQMSACFAFLNLPPSYLRHTRANPRDFGAHPKGQSVSGCLDKRKWGREREAGEHVRGKLPFLLLQTIYTLVPPAGPAISLTCLPVCLPVHPPGTLAHLQDTRRVLLAGCSRMEWRERAGRAGEA